MYYQQRIQDIKTSTEPVSRLVPPRFPATISHSPVGSKTNLDEFLQVEKSPVAVQSSLNQLDQRSFGEKIQDSNGNATLVEYSKPNKISWQKKILSRIAGGDILQIDLRETKNIESAQIDFRINGKYDLESSRKHKSPIKNNIQIPKLLRYEKEQFRMNRPKDQSQQELSLRDRTETPKKSFHMPQLINLQKNYQASKAGHINSARQATSIEKDYSLSGIINTARQETRGSLGLIANRNNDEYGLENNSRNKRILENIVLSKTPHGAKKYTYSPEREREIKNTATVKPLNLPSALLYNKTIIDDEVGPSSLKVVSARNLHVRQDNAYIKRMKDVDSSVPKIPRSMRNDNHQELIVRGFNNESQLPEKLSKPLWLERYNLGGKMRSEPDLPKIKKKSHSREPREKEEYVPKNWFKLQEENRRNKVPALSGNSKAARE